MRELVPRSLGTDHRDRGQAIGVVIVVVAMVVSVGLALAGIAVRLVDEGRAHTAADAAALAGVDHGRAAAAEAAAANGARLIRYTESTSATDVTVSVEVSVGEETAAARASTAP